jgi:TolB-like protein/DNA-binding winged helix-turn-helix (wHTH) protein
VIRFGPFRLDIQSGELHRGAARIRLRQQACRVLALLAQNPGRMLTREELRSVVWGPGTYVDFEQGLNHCIQEVRAALGDQAVAPLYIETLPRRGYRFIGRISGAAETVAPVRGEVTRQPRAMSGRVGRPGPWMARLGPGRLWSALLAVAAALGLLLDRGAPGRERQRVVLAVLPFECVAGTGPEQASLAEGLTEELTAQLGRLPLRLAVLARSATLRYKPGAREVVAAGRELRADFVVEGSVLQTQARVRITARLVRVADGARVWTSMYEQDLHDVLTLERSLAAAMASELSVALLAQPGA